MAYCEENQPSAVPTFTFAHHVCVADSASWYKDGSPDKGCDWLAEDLERCDKEDSAGVTGRVGCDATCYECEAADDDSEDAVAPAPTAHECVADSTSWYKDGSPDKGCDWVAEDLERCDSKEDSAGVTGRVGCDATCYECEAADDATDDATDDYVCVADSTSWCLFGVYEALRSPRLFWTEQVQGRVAGQGLRLGLRGPRALRQGGRRRRDRERGLRRDVLRVHARDGRRRRRDGGADPPAHGRADARAHGRADARAHARARVPASPPARRRAPNPRPPPTPEPPDPPDPPLLRRLAGYHKQGCLDALLAQPPVAVPARPSSPCSSCLSRR